MQVDLQYKKQTKMFQASIKDVEVKKDEEIEKLKEDIGKLYQLNSAAHMEAIATRKQHLADKNSVVNYNNAARVFAIIKQWGLARKGFYFRIWTTNNTLISAAQQFRNHMVEQKQQVNEGSVSLSLLDIVDPAGGLPVRLGTKLFFV